MGPVLFSVINDLDNGAERTLSKFLDDTNVGVVAGTSEGCAAVQRNLKELEESHQVQQREEKRKVLLLKRINTS